jgi:hypothetical protein
MIDLNISDYHHLLEKRDSLPVSHLVRAVKSARDVGELERQETEGVEK